MRVTELCIEALKVLAWPYVAIVAFSRSMPNWQVRGLRPRPGNTLGRNAGDEGYRASDVSALVTGRLLCSGLMYPNPWSGPALRKAMHLYYRRGMGHFPWQGRGRSPMQLWCLQRMLCTRPGVFSEVAHQSSEFTQAEKCFLMHAD